MNKTLVAVLAIAGTVGTATAFAADREIKVDDRLDASAETLDRYDARFRSGGSPMTFSIRRAASSSCRA